MGINVGFDLSENYKERMPIPDGTWGAEIKAARSEVARSGRKMLVFELTIHADGQEHNGWIRLVLPLPEDDAWENGFNKAYFFLRKLRGAFDSCGLEPPADGDIDPEVFVGLSCNVKVDPAVIEDDNINQDVNFV